MADSFVASSAVTPTSGDTTPMRSNRTGPYRKGDGSPIDTGQVHAGVHHAPRLGRAAPFSEGTVRNHLSAAIQKVGARNRAEAARNRRGKGLARADVRLISGPRTRLALRRASTDPRVRYGYCLRRSRELGGQVPRTCVTAERADGRVGHRFILTTSACGLHERGATDGPEKATAKASDANPWKRRSNSCRRTPNLRQLIVILPPCASDLL